MIKSNKHPIVSDFNIFVLPLACAYDKVIIMENQNDNEPMGLKTLQAPFAYY